MEWLRHDDPPQIGPHITLARLDAGFEQAVSARRFIARSADGDRTFLACLPRIDVDPTRWAIEAEGARRLSIPGFLPVGEVGGTAELPWCTAPYVPALPLPAALRAHGGPLPEPVARALGAALARTLATAHAHGVTHAGLSPAAVLLTTEGPRLSCFGAVRAAAPDGEQRSGLPGLESGSLAPEQAAGGRPQPLGDVYALGAVLAYAGTGHTVPERNELPSSFRELVAACLSRDPQRRPQAHQVLAHLESATRTAAHQAGVLDAAVPMPLPAAVVAAIARQSGQILAAELPAPASLD
ncbi:serine/threonine protein kinase [Streptomyces sp. BR123]|uniref:serine/threonine protein kinase n=1 Tax=Streptomyces sp. BR123 TaxID=2749828 RepID=UPI0015C4AAB5|nr:serine/threonine protein kinase [Streptomyces sp. BR123]NXY98945.1 serine/threonine protein kinase [Streptomyces sp. BR123]